MTSLQHAIDLIRNSDPHNWNVIETGFGPMYLDEFGEVSSGDQRWLEHRSHYARAAYRPDVQLGLAWGLSRRDDKRSFHWANFADPTIYTTVIDVLWNAMLIQRYPGLVVDGGRAILPFPELDTSVDPVVEYFDAEAVDVFRVVSETSTASARFDEYLDRTGLDIR